MVAYTPRLTAPDRSNRNFYEKNIFYISGNGLPNCTCFSWGRWLELGISPKLCPYDAFEWYGYNDPYARGQTPKLGAIMCFRGGLQGFGHVCVVEQINPDGSFVTSNSDYGGRFFYLETVPANNYNRGALIFQGFIYNPNEYTTSKKEVSDLSHEKTLKDIYYKVQWGDTLSGIASKYNTTIEKIISWNRGQIDNPNLIYSGDILKVGEEVKERYVYIVKAGDTLSGIASRYNTTVDALLKLNPSIKNRDLIYINQHITIK